LTGRQFPQVDGLGRVADLHWRVVHGIPGVNWPAKDGRIRIESPSARRRADYVADKHN
jgi:hypothetical protein